MSEWPLSKECFVTPVALAAIRKFGPESLEWDPLILRDAFEEQFEIKKMSTKLFDKLNCGYMLIGTDAFNSTIEGFLSATCIMNNLVFDESEAPFCSLEMCAWSTWEAAILLGDIDQGRSTALYCPDIIKYIQEVGKLNGVSQFPKWMSFANPEDGSMPDLTGDADAFTAYQNRQQAYINDLNGFVTAKQELLTKELTILQTAGILG
jgi:hypothetical protein